MRITSRLASVVAFAAVLAPVGAGATITSCNIPQPCAEFTNNNGVALEGASAGADGVLGEASSGTIYGAGVEGESLKQTGADAAGTFGLTLLSSGVAPNYGVVAYGSLYGVYGQAASSGLSSTGPSYGVFGQDNAGSATTDYNVGVVGRSTYGTGMLAEANGTPTIVGNVYGFGKGEPTGLYAVAKTDGSKSASSSAIIAESDDETLLAYNTYSDDYVAVSGPDDVLAAAQTNVNNDFFSVDNQGDEYLAGNLQVVGKTTMVHGGPYLQTTGASGKTVTAYSEHTTTPELADVGEAQLVNGRAFVPIDAALADVVDLRGGYHVFITPEGDSKGLYVVKGAGGFFVREQQGGRSTLPFDYRIVAKPREESGTRLARVNPIEQPVSHVHLSSGAKSHPMPIPLSPEERLKRQIGPRAYAKIMAALSERFTALHAH